MGAEVESGAGLDRENLPGPRFLSVIEKAGLDLSVIAIVVLALLVTVSIAGRLILGSAIPDDIIIAGELMVALVALPWAIVTADRGHIAVEVFTTRVKGSGNIWLDILSTFAALVMMVPLTLAVGSALMTSIDYGSYFDGDLYLPQWPGRLMFFLGYALMLARFAFLLRDDACRLYNYRGESVTTDKDLL